MLVSLPEVRAEARTGPRQATSEPPVSDILWMFGTLATGEGYCAQGIRPDGSQVATLHGLPHAVCRTTDGTSIVTATAAAGTPTQVTIHDATTGAVSHQFHGSFTWPEEPDLTLSVDRRSGAYAVAGTMLVSSPTGHYADKMAPGGGTRRVPITSWAAYEGLETFAPSGSHLDSAAPSKAELGFSTQIAHSGSNVILIQHGPTGTRIKSGQGSALHRMTTWEAGEPAQLVHVDTQGRAYLMRDSGDLGIWTGPNHATLARLGLNSFQSGTARPYPVSVISTAANTVAVVDASRQYLSIVDPTTGEVIRRRTLSTSTRFQSPADTVGQAAAVDLSRRRLYVLDRSGVAGGLWVHDADTLEVIDRWHSDAMFRLVWVAQTSGTVFLQTNDGPVAVHGVDGSVVSYVESDLHTATAL